MKTDFKFLLHSFFFHKLVQVSHRTTRFSLLSSMLISPMFLERVVTCELLLTRRTNLRLLRTWLSMLLGSMVVHLLFALCIKISVCVSFALHKSFDFEQRAGKHKYFRNPSICFSRFG